MTPAALFSLGSLTLFSLADLRYRVAPGVTAYFLTAVLLAAVQDPLRVMAVLLAVGWGGWNGPPWLAGPALFSPATWAVLITGAGVRRGMVGRADLLALGGLACLFDWPAAVLALIGVEVWRRVWGRWGSGPMPAVVGMLLGLGVYLMFGERF